MKDFFELWPVRAVIVIGLIAIYGVYAYAMVVLVIRYYIGDGEWKKGLLKTAAAVAALWVALRFFHLFAFWIWDATPVANQFDETRNRYDDLCTAFIRDDENSGHQENDWHAGDRICYDLAKQVYVLYPRPAWLFGTAPNLAPD